MVRKRRNCVRTNIHKTAQLGELVVAAFDGAASYSADPRRGVTTIGDAGRGGDVAARKPGPMSSPAWRMEVGKQTMRTITLDLKRVVLAGLVKCGR